MRKALDGSVKNTLTLGLGTNQISIRTNSGIPQAKSNLGNYSFLGSGFDLVITSQDDFNNAVERVSTGIYRFKSAYKSIYIKAGGGDILEYPSNADKRIIDGAYDISQLLSGGDGASDGVLLRTNNVQLLYCEPATQWYYGPTAGYVEISGPGEFHNIRQFGDASTYQMEIGYAEHNEGVTDGFAIGNITGQSLYGFLIIGTSQDGSAGRLVGCEVWGRRVQTGFNGFDDPYIGKFGLENWSFENCRVIATSYSVDDNLGFNQLYNLKNCYAAYVGQGVTDGIYSFSNCYNLDNCVSAFNGLSSTSGINVSGYNSCLRLSNCLSKGNGKSAEVALGFESCNKLVNCHALYNGTNSPAVASGFYGCTNISNCTSEYNGTNSDVDTVAGFNLCYYIASSVANNNGKSGASVTGNGFIDCTYTDASCISYSNTLYDWINCSVIGNVYSQPSKTSGNVVSCFQFQETISNNATLSLGAETAVYEIFDSNNAKFHTEVYFTNGDTSPHIIVPAGEAITDTVDTALSLNIYVSSGNLTLQNKLGSSKSFVIKRRN